MHTFTRLMLAATAVLTLSPWTILARPAQAGGGSPPSATQSAQATPTAAPSQAAPSQTATTPAPAGNAAAGRKLFVSDGCYQCHGFEAQGSSATGPRLGPRPLPFAALSRYVRAPTGQMPPYGVKIVSDTDLADIYAFLRSLPEPPSVKTLPLLE